MTTPANFGYCGSMRLRTALLTLAAIALSYSVKPASAQLSSAGITGAVEDSTNGRIPEANVKLINTLTGAENDSKTNSFGIFVLPGLNPGAYVLQIERSSFATTQIRGIVLNIGDTKAFLIRLKLGTLDETVIVDASGVTLNTTDAAVSTIVDRRFVGTVPLNGRSFQDLISMTPGVNTQTPQAFETIPGGQGDFSANGQGTGSNSYTIDGLAANSGPALTIQSPRTPNTGSEVSATALGTTQSLTSVDALQEFRVLTSTYPAEYGRTPGAQFTLLTRSGFDEVHGSAYDYFRDHVFDASDWFTDTGEPNLAKFHQNDFGGTVGAPLILPGIYNGREKTFLFASYEGLRLDQPGPRTIQYTPLLNSDLTPDPIKAIFSNFPNYTTIGGGGNAGPGLTPYYNQTYALPSHVDSTSVRIDQIFSPKLSTFFRFAETPSYSQTRQLSSQTINRLNTKIYTFGLNAQVSAVVNNELRLGYVSSGSNLNTMVVNDGNVAGYAPVPLNTALGISNPQASAASYIHIVGIGQSEVNTDHATASFGQWNLKDTLSLQTGRHFLRIGVDERHIMSTLTPAPLSVAVNFYDVESLLTSRTSTAVVTKNTPARPVISEFSAFIQDEWRLSKEVSISAGLRWEIDPAPHGQHDEDAYTVLGNVTVPSTLTLAPRGTPLWKTSWSNIVPRVGTAWTINSTPGKELVLRAGGGAYFDTPHRAEGLAFTGLGFSTFNLQSNIPVPIAASQLDFSTEVAPPYTHSIAYALPSHLQLPYFLEWNVGLEQAFRKNQTLTVSYVGSEGRRLLREQRKDVITDNPLFGDVVFFPGHVTSNYQGLQIKFQRTLTHGVQALGSYVLSHSLDYGSTDPAYPLTYGNSDLDVRHNLQAALSWDLTTPDGHGLSNYLWRGWGTDARVIARTGYPITLFGNLLSDAESGQRYYSGVDVIKNRPLYLYGQRDLEYPSTNAGGRAVNGGPFAASPAFTLPANDSAGDAPRNIVRGFGSTQINFAVRRQFQLRDRLNLQFRAEAFNVLNHPSFGYVNPYLTDQLFGQSTLLLNQSFGPTGSLYQQGGPRSIQFSLRLAF